MLSSLHRIGIDYLAPADARNLPFDNDYFDAHVSYTVLEHIPRDVLRDIFIEAKRIVRPAGVILHNVDFTDHFSHSDRHISAINFLKFNECDYDRLAGNKFMYMNRLRDDDFRALWHELSLVPFVVEKSVSGNFLCCRRLNRFLTMISLARVKKTLRRQSWYGCIVNFADHLWYMR